MGIPVEAQATARALAVFPELVPQDSLWTDSRQPFRRLKRSKPVVVNRDISPDHARLRASSLSFSNLHHHGGLMIDYLRARRETFIDTKGWDLPQVDGMEFDQYDTPYARWIVLHEYGEVMAGVRLIPTDRTCGLHSYMIRDAQLGLLPNIPSDLLYMDAPTKPYIWEATRLFVVPSVPSNRRIAIQTLLMQQMSSTARDLGASHVIGIVPAVFSRWMTRLGLLSALPVGRLMDFDNEKSQAALMNVSLQSS